MVAAALIQKIASLFIILFMGALIVKSGIVKAEDSKILTKVFVYLICPCAIINSFQVELTDDTRNGLILAFVAAVLIHVVLLICTPIVGKIFKLDGLEKASFMYSNSANLVIPIVAAVFGQEWVIYSCAYVSVQTILLWTHCKALICEEKSFDIKKIVTNINIIAIIIGIIIFLMQIKLPNAIAVTLKDVGGMLGPIAMMITGMLIGGMSLQKILSYKRVWMMTALRLILCPAIILVCIKLSGLANMAAEGTTILMISLLATATPSASTCTQLAQLYGKDAEYSSIMNTVTTILCIVTLPIVVSVYQMW